MIKVDIFSGFLGAGKTTLIRKLIQEAFQGEKLVLIENEFGEIGIDGTFMQDAGIEVTELNSGCICCSLVGDFGKALTMVVDTYKPDRILIEPSGVGKLSDVTLAVESSGAEDLVINSMTTVVDAKKAKAYIANFGEFYNNQIEAASCIVLSRTDDISEKKLADVVALLKQHNPNATVITTPWPQLDGATILSAMEKKDTLAEALKELAEQAEHEEHHHHHHDEDEDEHEHHHHHHDDDDEDEDEHEHHHHHHHDDDDGDEDEHEHHHHHHHDEDEDEHEHHHHHHDEHGHHHHHHGHDADEVFVSWGLETPRKYSEEELKSILAKLDDKDAYGIVLRSKGAVDSTDGEWIYFDYVPEETDIRRGAAVVTGRICVIGSELKEDALKELFGV